MWELLYKINDDWDALLTQSYQNIDSQGVFYEMPFGTEGASLTSNAVPIGGQPLPPLSVTLFNPSYNKDKFENTALVVNGKIGDLKLVYSGAYLVRNVDQQQDYTNYARGVFGYYYQCAGYSKTDASKGQCYTPSTVWTEQEHNTFQSHEVRLSTPDDLRIRGLVGVYWEDYIDRRPDPLEVRDGSDLLADRARRQLLPTHPTVAGIACIHPQPPDGILR